MKIIHLDPPIRTRTITFTSDTLEKAWDAYTALVEDYAEEMFERYVRPWLVKNRCVFISGNGAWYLHKTLKSGMEVELFDDKCPKHIAKWLNMPIPGEPYNTLGCIMPHYD